MNPFEETGIPLESLEVPSHIATDVMPVHEVSITEMIPEKKKPSPSIRQLKNINDPLMNVNLIDLSCQPYDKDNEVQRTSPQLFRINQNLS